jgi:putative Mg2+ transporter-C (MgtC) family protein
MDDLELIKRLCLSAALGAVLGMEREWRQKDAGLRTNILIAMGSALFTVMSIDVSTGSGGDSTRIASGIVTGIGFLGAGAIMRKGSSIKGLTTAAMIWVNAAIGVAVGGGEYRVAIIATTVALVVLVVLDPIERALVRRHKPRKQADAPTDDESSAAAEGGPVRIRAGVPHRSKPE